jgi:hypothetical protein
MDREVWIGHTVSISRVFRISDTLASGTRLRGVTFRKGTVSTLPARIGSDVSCFLAYFHADPAITVWNRPCPLPPIFLGDCYWAYLRSEKETMYEQTTWHSSTTLQAVAVPWIITWHIVVTTLQAVAVPWIITSVLLSSVNVSDISNQCLPFFKENTFVWSYQ